LSFHVSQAAKLTEKGTPSAPSSGFGEEGRRDCRMENRYSGLPGSMLRLRRDRPWACRAD
jgi:hypothetical protein